MYVSPHTHTHTHTHTQITSSQLNNSPTRFFDIYSGTYRDISVIVKQVRNVEGWDKELYAMFKEEAVKLRLVLVGEGGGRGVG